MFLLAPHAPCAVSQGVTLTTYPWDKSTWAVRLLFRDHGWRRAFREVLENVSCCDSDGIRARRALWRLLAFLIITRDCCYLGWGRCNLLNDWIAELREILDKQWDSIGCESSTKFLKFHQLRDYYGI